MRIEYPSIKGSGEIWLDVVKAICADAPKKDYSSLCDLMCHKAPYTPQLGFFDRVFVDIQDRDLDFPDEKLLNFIQMGAIEFLQKTTDFYDLCICSDGIEHLSKEEGMELIWWMRNKSNAQIIFTPLGEQSVTKDSHPDSHKSGWHPIDFQGWCSIVFPNFHPQLNCGAFFTFHCDNLKEEFERVKTELNTKSWAKLSK